MAGWESSLRPLVTQSFHYHLRFLAQLSLLSRKYFQLRLHEKALPTCCWSQKFCQFLQVFSSVHWLLFDFLSSFRSSKRPQSRVFSEVVHLVPAKFVHWESFLYCKKWSHKNASAKINNRITHLFIKESTFSWYSVLYFSIRWWQSSWFCSLSDAWAANFKIKTGICFAQKFFAISSVNKLCDKLRHYQSRLNICDLIVNKRDKIYSWSIFVHSFAKFF